MNLRILYNQDAGNGGGGTPPAATGSPASGAAAPASASQGSTTPAQNFAMQLREIAGGKPQQQTQPASDGNETDPPASGTEGVTDGHATDDHSTTAADGVTPTDGKGAEGKWSEDDQKFLEAQGFKNLEWSDELQKLVKSTRELRSNHDRLSGSNANAISQIETVKRAAYSGDLKALQDALGVDLQINRRTPDDILQEIHKDATEYQATMQDVLDEFLKQGNQEAANAVVKAWNAIAAKLDSRANIVVEEKKWKERESQFLQKAGKTSDPKDAYKAAGEKATNNLAALAQEDPQASQWFKAIEEATKPGGELAALNIDLARAYGTSLQTARFFNKVGKALITLQTMPQILAAERTRAEADYERKKAAGGPRGSTTGGSARGQTSNNPVMANLQNLMSSAAQRK